MNSRQIEILLERYFDGSTSLEDEEKLKDFFEKDDIPPHLISLKGTFNFFSSEKKQNHLNESFDEKVIAKIQEEEVISIRQNRRKYIYYAGGIAASILIIVSIFINFNPFTSRLADTFDNPQTAYFETKRALLFLSGNLNKSVKPIDNMEKFDEGVTQLRKISSLSKGMQEFEKISTFYETQQKIINN